MRLHTSINPIIYHLYIIYIFRSIINTQETEKQEDFKFVASLDFVVRYYLKALVTATNQLCKPLALLIVHLHMVQIFCCKSYYLIDFFFLRGLFFGDRVSLYEVLLTV